MIDKLCFKGSMHIRTQGLLEASYFWIRSTDESPLPLLRGKEQSHLKPRHFEIQTKLLLFSKSIHYRYTAICGFQKDAERIN